MFLPALAVALVAACSDSGTSGNLGTGGSAGSGGAGGVVTGGASGSSTAGSSVAGSAIAMAGTSAQAGSGGASGGSGGAAGSAGAGGTSAGTGGSAAGSGGSAGGPPVCTVPATGGEDFSGLLTGPKTVEGEAAKLGGAAAVASEGSGWTGTGFADMKANEGSMTWLVNVPAAGKYTASWLYTQNDARDMRLTVDCTQKVESLAFINTHSWNTDWISGGEQVVTLTKGSNMIVLETNGGSGPNFDSMTITPPVCVLGNAATLCEAEAALMSGAAGLASAGNGWTGPGFADMFGAEGVVNWVVDAPNAGSYKLTFRYTQDDLRDMALTVNGVQASASIQFNDSNSWNTNWVADVSIDVDLEAGLNSLQLATNGASGPNFDSVSVLNNDPGGDGGAGAGGAANGGAGGAP